MSVIARPDGSAVYTTAQDDKVDRIARSYYGTHIGTTELIYEANPGLADQPLVLPMGVSIVLPAFATAPRPIPTISLWD